MKELNETQPIQKWAKDYFLQVDEARKASERLDRMYQAKRAKAYSLPAHVEKDTVNMVDTEADNNIAYQWINEVLESWDQMMYVVRPGLVGAIGDGLDIAHAKYRMGFSNKSIEQMFKLNRQTIYRDLNATIDYLDYMGPVRGLLPDPDPRQETPPDFVAFDDDDFEDDSPYLTDYQPDTLEEINQYLKELSNND